MVGRADHSEASLTLLAIKAKYSHLSLAVRIWAVYEAVTLVRIDHVCQLVRENVVATIFALFLPSDRVYVLNGQVAIKVLRIKLAFCRLAALEVYDCRHFNIVQLLTIHGALHVLLSIYLVLPGL